MCNQMADQKLFHVTVMHEAINGPDDGYICKHCSELLWKANLDPAYYYVPYPCPTVLELRKTDVK